MYFTTFFKKLVITKENNQNGHYYFNIYNGNIYVLLCILYHMKYILYVSQIHILEINGHYYFNMYNIDNTYISLHYYFNIYNGHIIYHTIYITNCIYLKHILEINGHYYFNIFNNT